VVGGGSKKAVDGKEENVEEVEEVEEVEKAEDKTLRKSADLHLRKSARKERRRRTQGAGQKIGRGERESGEPPPL